MAVPWKIARLFVRCAEYLCHCHQSEALCPLQMKRYRLYKRALFLTRELRVIITLCCYWSFYMPNGYVSGSSRMSYCNQTPFPPRKGWDLGTRLGVDLIVLRLQVRIHHTRLLQCLDYSLYHFAPQASCKNPQKPTMEHKSTRSVPVAVVFTFVTKSTLPVELILCLHLPYSG